MSIDINTDAYERGYRAGAQAQVEVCVEHNLTRIADVLDAVERHVGDSEKLRAELLRVLGHGAP